MYVTRIEKLLCAYSPVPLCILNPQGKVARASDKIDEVFIYDGIQGADVFTLTGIKYLDIREATGEGRPLILSRNEKVFKILTSLEKESWPVLSCTFLMLPTMKRLKSSAARNAAAWQ